MRAAIGKPVKIAGGREMSFEDLLMQGLYGAISRGDPSAVRFGMELLRELSPKEQQAEVSEQEVERQRRIFEDLVDRRARDLNADQTHGGDPDEGDFAGETGDEDEEVA